MNSPPATILIVDDDPTYLDIITLHLTRASYKFLIAKSGAEGILQAHALKPDLILLDINMPDLDGLETCYRLKADVGTQNIPIIFLTTRLNAVAEGFAAGGVDYIFKTAPLPEVLARIKTHLAMRFQTEELKRINEQLGQQVEELARLNMENARLIDEERHQRHLAEERNKELDAFAHTVAHDLKGPLGIIVGMADFLVNQIDGVEPKQRIDHLKTIRRSGHKGANIVDELLLLAGIRKQNVRLEPVNMPLVLEHAIQRVEVLREEVAGEIIISDHWPVARGYAPWVEEMWVNYLSNGLKYGGRPAHLELGANRQSNGLVRFWVRDNGPGISAEQQAILFTEFTRLDKVQAKGHGLGLSIVRRIAEKLGGQVGLESKVGQGSTFYFTLPREEKPRTKSLNLDVEHHCI